MSVKLKNFQPGPYVLKINVTDANAAKSAGGEVEVSRLRNDAFRTIGRPADFTESSIEEVHHETRKWTEIALFVLIFAVLLAGRRPSPGPRKSSSRGESSIPAEPPCRTSGSCS